VTRRPRRHHGAGTSSLPASAILLRPDIAPDREGGA
jgi:hypothetical protein